jgi:hypothetical protein
MGVGEQGVQNILTEGERRNKCLVEQNFIVRNFIIITVLLLFHVSCLKVKIRVM